MFLLAIAGIGYIGGLSLPVGTSRASGRGCCSPSYPAVRKGRPAVSFIAIDCRPIIIKG